MIIKLDIFWHCRSSIFYGGLLALFLKSKDLHLIGIDGYSGYFSHNKNLIPEDIPSKHTKLGLHSSSNPMYGEPTITDAFLALSSKINTYVVSKNVLLKRFLKYKKIPSKKLY